MRPTKRAPDVWDSAAFSSIFLASSFSCSQALSTPAHTQVTRAVGRLSCECLSTCFPGIADRKILGREKNSFCVGIFVDHFWGHDLSSLFWGHAKTISRFSFTRGTSDLFYDP